MTKSNFNQNNVNKRTFCDFICAMQGYKLIINGQDRAKLAGTTADIVSLNQTSNELTETHLLGLLSFGKLMAHAVENAEADISRVDLINAGYFVSLVAESANAINEVAVQTRTELGRRGQS